VTVAARRSLRLAGGRLPAEVRFGRVALTLAVSLGLILLLLHIPPFMAAGADLADGTQRDYASNIWQETQTSLALVAIVLPWLVYGLLWHGAAWGRRVLLVLATAGVLLTTWFVLVSLQSYAALPQQVTGVVDHVQSRTIFLRGGRSYYLVVSDAELRSAANLLAPGARLTMWVSPRGHAGSVSADLQGY